MKRRPLILVAATFAVASVTLFGLAHGSALLASDTDFRTSQKAGTPSGAAHDFVARESPPGVFAFKPSVPGSSTRPVIVHYFPPFPLTIGGYGLDKDYYARNYLRPEGENGKFLTRGGYLRQRPLQGPASANQLQSDIRVELARAARIGVDAFGVDLLALNGKVEMAVPNLLDAARQTDPRFRIAIEPDMRGLKRVTLDELFNYLVGFAKHPAAFRLADGRVLVMPFSAEARTPEFWRELIDRMAAAGEPIAFVPDFVNSSGAEDYSSLSAAAASWGSRDSKAGWAQRAFGLSMKLKGYPAWIATGAPQDFRPKNGMFSEAQGSYALTSAIKAGIDGGASAVHMVTWNDYSEATELQPSSATRFAYYDIAAYYTAWFKTGAPPPIVRDGFVGLHRKQLFHAADKTRGHPWWVRGAAVVDIVEMTAFLTAPADLTITSGGKTYSERGVAGLNRFEAPAATGAVSMAIRRNGRIVANCKSPWMIEANPGRHDPIYAGFSSLRGCR